MADFQNGDLVKATITGVISYINNDGTFTVESPPKDGDDGYDVGELWTVDDIPANDMKLLMEDRPPTGSVIEYDNFGVKYKYVVAAGGLYWINSNGVPCTTPLTYEEMDKRKVRMLS